MGGSDGFESRHHEGGDENGEHLEESHALKESGREVIGLPPRERFVSPAGRSES